MGKRRPGEPLLYTCARCGKQEDLALYNHRDPFFRRMRKESLCYDCLHWTKAAEEADLEAVAISGALYRVKLLKPARTIAAALKKPDCKCVLEIKTKKAYVVSSLLCKGAIPDDMKGTFPDQYYFISPDEYRRVQRRRARFCLAKGCLDRYRCLWYSKRRAEPHEKWNRVLSKHKPGIEKCPTFVNIKKLRNYDYINP